MPDRWLVVFDNVDDSRQISKWIPSSGDCDIIVTTVDGTAYGLAKPIEVEGFERRESLEYLNAALETEEMAPSQTLVLGDLAKTLGDWPLALSMAANYISNSSLRLAASTQKYLEILASNMISDVSSIPEGYPKTLGAAILTAISTVKSGDRTEEFDAPLAAMAVLSAAAYFAERDIPLNLLLASALLEPASTENSGLVGALQFENFEIETASIVLILRRSSLVVRHRSSALGNSDEFMADRLTINAITQLVVRGYLARNNSDDRILKIISDSSYHMNRCLAHALDEQLFERVQQLEAHADRLATHAEENRICSIPTVLLAGNLAGACRVRGEFARAKGLLCYELAQLETISSSERSGVEDRPNILVAKVYVQYLEAALECDDPTSVLVQIGEFGCEILKELALGVSDMRAFEAQVEAFSAVLETCGKRRAEPAFLRLRESIGRLAVRELDGLTSVISRISELIRTGDDDTEALRLIASIEASDPPLPVRFQAPGLRAETLAWAGDFEGAAVALDQMMSIFEVNQVFVRDAVVQLHNIGWAAAKDLQNERARALLATVLGHSKIRLDKGDADDVSRYLALRSWLQVANGGP
ncbi:hypothetical protein [Tsukamurella pseudospumae]|uniref:hypothetical protein n=1 Tax=Tsukamurella pseudospumae TaxID=239498 RepID=UPI0012E7B065|nr:hypothetical protein [Tsukamurella pseudospumae]